MGNPMLLLRVFSSGGPYIKVILGMAVAFLSLAAMHAEPVRLRAVRVEGSDEIRISWDGSTSESYQVEFAPGPGAPFLPISGMVRGDTNSSFSDSVARTGMRFYRVSTLDPDAAGYVTKAGLLDASAIASMSHWVEGLKNLALFQHVAYMTSLQKSHNTSSGKTVSALKGPTGVIQGAPAWTDQGLSFAADGWVTIPNPFGGGYLSELSLLAVFDSDQSAGRLIFGSESELHGPSLLAGGSAWQGVSAENIFFDYSVDGTTAPLNYGHGGRRTFVGGNTGGPEMALATFSPDDVSCQANMDIRFHDSGTFPAIWNNNLEWRIGARLDGAFPFVGTISMVAAFDVAISDAQFDQIRRLYRETLGATIALPSVNVIIEGDSLSEESIIITWGQELFLQPNWNGKFNKRNVARGGEAIIQMVDEFESQVLPYATQPGRNYLFIWGGAREIKQRSGEAAFADLQTYWAMGRKAGFKIVTFTILPNGEPTPQVPARRARLNELIRGAHDEYDFLIDVAQHPLLQDPYNATYYRPDLVHLWREGNVLIAEMINSVIPNP